ncbi:MAG TPA: hypothetical protein VIJ00_16470, partial [Nakamurella sp.]
WTSPPPPHAATSPTTRSPTSPAPWSSRWRTKRPARTSFNRPVPPPYRRRTAAVPLPVLGRCIAGLAEAIQLRLRERDDIDHLRTTVAQLAQALSAIGQITSENTSDPTGRGAPAVMMPPGLVNRAARYLEAAAVIEVIQMAYGARDIPVPHGE